MVLLQFPLAVIAVGHPDRLLLTLDKALGFDWLDFALKFQDRHWTSALMAIYASMRWEFCFVPFVLSFTNRIDRAWKFVTASFVAIIMCVALSHFLPRVGST